MVKACVLIKAVPTKMDNILKSILELPEVKKAYFTYGRFDIVCFLEAEDSAKVSSLTAKINSIEGVRSSETLIEA